MSFLLFLHVIVAIALIGLILIQHGKGADAGAAFGSGSSSTVFGARGAASFLSRATSILATLFFALSLSLFIIEANKVKSQDLAPDANVPVKPVLPAKGSRPDLSKAGSKTTDKPNANPDKPVLKEKATTDKAAPKGKAKPE